MDARDVLFSKTQQRLIAVLFSDEALQGLTYAEILRRTEGGAGAIHRELKQFLAAELVVKTAGDFKPNTGHPVYPELRAMAKKLFRETAPLNHLPPQVATQLGRKYLWWIRPREVLKNQDRLVAQVMNMGTFDDARLVEKALGRAKLRSVLKAAPPGHFDRKAWTFWHYRLGLAKPDRVPPMPQRRFA